MYRFLECTAAQYMTRPVMTVTRQLTIGELGKLFEKHDFNSFPVVEDGNLLGIVTKLDFLRAFAFTTGQMLPHYDDLMQRRVAEMMMEAVVHVEPTAPLTRVLQLMVSLKMRSFPRHRSRAPIARHNLARRRDARPRRSNQRHLTGRALPRRSLGWARRDPRRRIAHCLGCAVPIAGFRQAGADIGNLAEIE